MFSQCSDEFKNKIRNQIKGIAEYAFKDNQNNDNHNDNIYNNLFEDENQDLFSHINFNEELFLSPDFENLNEQI